MRDSLVWLFAITTTLLLWLSIFGYRNSQWLKKETKYITWYVYFAFAIQVVSGVMWFQGINNLWLLHVYTLGEFILLTLFYFHNIPNLSRQQQLFIKGILIGGSIFIVVNSVFLQPINIYNSHGKAASCVLICLFGLFYYVRDLKQPYVRDLIPARTAMMVINSSIFIYFSGQFFFFMMGNYMADFFDRDLNIKIWVFYSILNVLFYAILLFGLWKLASHRKSYSG